MRLRPLPVSFALLKVADFVPLQVEVLEGVEPPRWPEVAAAGRCCVRSGAAGDTIAEFFADDIAAGVHSLNGMVSAGGLAVELAGYRRLQGLLPCNPVVGI